MNAKTTSLFAGIALLAGVGVANAEERLTAASMDSVTAAGGYDSLLVFKLVKVDVNVDGNLGHSSGDAKCFGGDCVAQVYNSSYSTPWSAGASGYSVSGTD